MTDTDLVSRLRDKQFTAELSDLYVEAADEIERRCEQLLASNLRLSAMTVERDRLSDALDRIAHFSHSDASCGLSAAGCFTAVENIAREALARTAEKP